jgi:hypothetical protein
LVFDLPRASFLLYFALAWPFLLRLLTEPSSHGVQDHQLGMFFFPLGLAIFFTFCSPRMLYWPLLFRKKQKCSMSFETLLHATSK